jgi:hypothetical protein
MRKPQPERLHTESMFGLLLRGVAARESAFAPLTHSLIDAMRVRNCASTSTMEGLQEDNEGAGSLLGPDMAQSALCSFRSDVPYDAIRSKRGKMCTESRNRHGLRKFSALFEGRGACVRAAANMLSVLAWYAAHFLMGAEPNTAEHRAVSSRL